MKKYLLVIFGSLLMFTGCKEIHPGIDFGIAVSADTTYMGPVPTTTDPHSVLVEDFTGQNCENCPAAHTNLETEVDANQFGRVNVLSLFIIGPPQTDPPSRFSVYDFRNQTATDIGSKIYSSPSSIPTVGVDRGLVPVTGGIQFGSSGQWDAAINSQLQTTDSLNLTVQSNYTGTVATTTVTVTYTQQVLTAQNINIALVEDSITDYQTYIVGIGPYPSGYDSAYVFTDVFRGMVTSEPYGDLINTPDKNPGRFYRRVYTYSLPPVYTGKIINNPPIQANHCRVIAFVSGAAGTNGFIAQSAQTPLVGH